MGFDADLVVLASDPARSINAFADVAYTIRGGRILYRPPAGR
jgi:imidazolonepropionase-like amidohydrolase